MLYIKSEKHFLDIIIMTKTVTLIRHAQSRANTGEDQGRNARLSAHGLVQAPQLSGKTELVIVSPLKRTMETYIHSNITASQVTMCDLVREQMDGHDSNYLEHEQKRVESLVDVQQRVGKAIEYILSLPHNHITIISHGLFIWHFLQRVGKPVQNVGNCEIFTIVI
jgi:broad specificity phosphatase PhoE